MNYNQTELQEKIIERTVDFFRKNNKGYLNLAMRVGKTRITIEFFKRFLNKSSKILICYRDNKIKSNWLAEFKKWDYENNNVVLCNFRSVNKYKSQHFDFLVVDEFHAASENERNTIKEISDNTKTLLLSGTVSKDTRYDWIEFDEIASYSTSQGINDGILADYKITVHLIELDNKVKKENKKGKLKTEKEIYKSYTYVIDRMKEEGKETLYLALARNRVSLSSIAKREYVISLLDRMKDKRVLVFTGLSNVAESLGIPFCHSKTKPDSLYDFINLRINHLALAAMGKVGVTYPKLDSVILMNFTYNSEETAQILNRAIRLDYNNKVADLHIICLKEEPEIKKLKQSLSMLDKNKVFYYEHN